MLEGWLAVAIILLTTLAFGVGGILYVRRRSLSVEDYLVSRNTARPSTAMATLVASVLGAWILFSPAEAATWAGLAGLIGYALGQAAPLVAFVFMGPRMRRLMPQGHSLTEYVWHRFGSQMYVFVLLVIVFYMFAFLAAEMTAIALAVQLMADTPLWLTAAIVGLITVAYTAHGGIRASIFTDRIQFFLILPLLVVGLVVAVVRLDGIGGAFSTAADEAPHLFRLDHWPGIEFGLALVIAIAAANLFHQGFWQRVYTCKDDSSLRQGFSMAGTAVVPVIFLAGAFGLMAVGLAVPPEQASVALFFVIMDVVPTWAVVLFMVLSLVLVMSSLDTLLNGITSAITSDLARARPSLRGNVLLRSARVLTLVLMVPAIYIASQGYSVLYLFLLADLVCAAAVFPVFLGLYSRRFSSGAALASSVVGLVAGAAFFPDPDFGAWNALPMSGNFLAAFGLALAVSAAISLGLLLFSRREEYDFSRLESVRLIDG